MVKFTATNSTGTTIIGLGLEDENVNRLKKGQPIQVRLSDLGFVGPMASMHIIIFHGKDARTMQRDLAHFIGPDTVVYQETKRKGE